MRIIHALAGAWAVIGFATASAEPLQGQLTDMNASPHKTYSFDGRTTSTFVIHHIDVCSS